MRGLTPTTAAGTVVSTSQRSPDGLSASSQQLGVANPSTSVTVLGGSGNWTTTSTSPDGIKQVQTYTAGLLTSSAQLDTNDAAIMSMSYGYDTLNRQITTTDSRTGATAAAYLSTTADIVASVTEPGSRTTVFAYDIRGRRITVDSPDTLDSNGATLANVVTTTYNPDSTVAETNGDQTYRTTHSYDYANRQIGMTTYGGTTATTTWNYTTDRGFLSRKEYHDGNGTDYTYTDGGRLATRTWSRGVVTTYNYDNAGRLTLTNYSDTTPDVVIAYDAMNRPVTNSNGVATTTFAYNASTLQLDTETLAYDFDTDNNIDFTRVIDRSQDGLQRLTGFELKDGTIVENQATYVYSATDGRLASVANATDTFNYNYLSNSNLLATVTGSVHTVTNTWETDRNVLDTKTNADLASTPVTVSEYDYSVNDLGQRTNVATSGTAFPATPSWDWGYNNKGEIVKADSSNNLFDRAFQYDGIGNRIEAVDGATSVTGTANYAANALNQYTAVGAINPVYDLDGNATAYPLPANASANSALTWDAENRLTSTTVSGTTTSYQYDSGSRRISKTTGATATVYVYDGWNVIAEYDGTSTPALTTTYTWGMDLSGSMQGAGGVGGLLAVHEVTGFDTNLNSPISNPYYPTYDGNGNISEYLDNAGVIIAHFEYDPFGNTVVDTDTTGQFSYRFSTKPIDQETGLYYYGYRYYDPLTGRWPSRDPIEEQGGVNLYGFVGNDGVNAWDVLGMWFADGTKRGATSDYTFVIDPAVGYRVVSSRSAPFNNDTSGNLLNTAARNHELRHIERVKASGQAHAVPYKQVFCVKKSGEEVKKYYYMNDGNELKLMNYNGGSMIWDNGTAVMYTSWLEQQTEEIREITAEIEELNKGLSKTSSADSSKVTYRLLGLGDKSYQINGRKVEGVLLKLKNLKFENKELSDENPGIDQRWTNFLLAHKNYKDQITGSGGKFNWEDETKIYDELKAE